MTRRHLTHDAEAETAAPRAGCIERRMTRLQGGEAHLVDRRAVPLHRQRERRGTEHDRNVPGPLGTVTDGVVDEVRDGPLDEELVSVEEDLLVRQGGGELDTAVRRDRGEAGHDALDDRQGAGPARRRNRSILDNATMAESLMRLSFLSRRPEFRREAIAALESFADDYREYGYYVAGYGRAVDLVFYEPLFLTIVGDRDGAALQELRRTALSTYVPSRIVQTLDPRHDPILLARSGLAVEAGPVVHLAVGDTPHGAARTPAELLAAIEAIEAGRRAKLA